MDGVFDGLDSDRSQCTGQEYFTSNLETVDILFSLYKMKYTYKLVIYYDWTPARLKDLIMKAGSAT